MKITILTPTYNRAYILPKLYKSLIEQTEKNFEWMIIDDGSKDDTKEIVSKWIEDSKIKIQYYYQKNGGKHKALNNGISKIKNELTFVVDSDDYLTQNAIELINHFYKKYLKEDNICGLSFLRKYPNDKIIGQKYKEDEYISNYISCRINENIVGDKAEIYKTSILKQYPFLEIYGENFLSEDYVWIQMSEKYNMVYINRAIYVGEYLTDGLTKNILKKKLNNPVGNSKRALILCSKKCNSKTRIKGMMLYISYGIYSKIKLSKLYKESKYKLLFCVCFIPAILYFFFLKFRNKYRFGGDL